MMSVFMETGVARSTLLQSEHHHHPELHLKRFYGTAFRFPYKNISSPALLIRRNACLITNHAIKPIMMTLNVFKHIFWTMYHKQGHCKMPFCQQFLMLWKVAGAIT